MKSEVLGMNPFTRVLVMVGPLLELFERKNQRHPSWGVPYHTLRKPPFQDPSDHNMDSGPDRPGAKFG